MRLLHVETLAFSVFYHPNIPPYAIVSHRWMPGGELMLSDFQQGKELHSREFLKVNCFAAFVRMHVSHVEWLWMDTCCIDQKSSQEVSESINSMFRWYKNAELCLAYLFDVAAPEDLTAFDQSVWFRRGWTLQELLAPRLVVFLAQNWLVIGHKGSANPSGIAMPLGASLHDRIASVTSIPKDMLQNYEQNDELTVETTLRWMKNRQTTREEDYWYCLLGLLGTSMNIRYGDGKEKTGERLFRKLHRNLEPVVMKGTPTQQSEGPAPTASPAKEEMIDTDNESARIALNSLASLYDKQGKLEQAEKLYLQVLQGREKALGAEHLSTIDTTYNLALVYGKQRKLAEAERLYMRALPGYETALGHEHPSTLDTLDNLGVIYRDLGKLDQAEEMCLRAERGYEKTLGAQHRSTRITINNLASIYHKQRKLALAEELYVKVLKMREQALGKNDTSTLATLKDLGVVYQDQQKLAQAEETFLTALERKENRFGPEHETTLATLNSLGLIYRDQGKLEQAESTLLRALRGKEKVLGPEHRSTLLTLNNLGNLYSRQGKLAQAENLYERTLFGLESCAITK